MTSPPKSGWQMTLGLFPTPFLIATITDIYVRNADGTTQSWLHGPSHTVLEFERNVPVVLLKDLPKLEWGLDIERSWVEECAPIPNELTVTSLSDSRKEAQLIWPDHPYWREGVMGWFEDWATDPVPHNHSGSALEAAAGVSLSGAVSAAFGGPGPI